MVGVGPAVFSSIVVLPSAHCWFSTVLFPARSVFIVFWQCCVSLWQFCTLIRGFIFQIRDVKLLLSLGSWNYKVLTCEYCWWIGLQIDFLETHDVLHIVCTVSFCLAAENSCLGEMELLACGNILFQLTRIMCTVCYSSWWENLAWNFDLVQILNKLTEQHNWKCTVCFLSWWKILGWGSWNL